MRCPIQKRRLFQTAALGFAALACTALAPRLTGARAADAPPANIRRIAVVYFSKSGNTKSLAEAVRAMTGAALFRVETVEPYPDQYRQATEVVQDELERGIIRVIKPIDVNLADYDVIVLATPTWWHHVAMPLQTWIKSVDLTGKKILTANTHGGGGLMHTREDFEKLLPGKNLGTHLTVYGATDPDDTNLRRWLADNGCL